MEGISAAIANVFTVTDTVITEVMGTPITAMFFVAGLIGLGVGIIRKLKRA